MNGCLNWVRSHDRCSLNAAVLSGALARALVVLTILFWICLTQRAQAQQRREREPNSVYADRRAKLAFQVDAPIVLWGFTGREEISEAYKLPQPQHRESHAQHLPRAEMPVGLCRELEVFVERFHICPHFM